MAQAASPSERSERLERQVKLPLLQRPFWNAFKRGNIARRLVP